MHIHAKLEEKEEGRQGSILLRTLVSPSKCSHTYAAASVSTGKLPTLRHKQICCPLLVSWKAKNGQNSKVEKGQDWNSQPGWA